MAWGHHLNITNINLGKKKRIIYIVAAVLAFLMLVLHTALGAKALVAIIEKMIIRRPSADPVWLIRFIRMNVDVYIGTLILASLFLVADSRNRLFFLVYTAYSYIVSTVIIWTGDAYVGYTNEWDFNDFLRPIEKGYGKSLYGTNYPPLAALIYRIFHNFIPADTENKYAMYYSLFLFMTITVLGLFFVFMKLYEKGRTIDKTTQNTAITVGVVVFMTNPIMFTYQRLNLVLLAIIFTVLFVIYYDSDNAVCRHIGLFSLAMAANIKYYPAIYGLLLLKKKRWKDAGIAFAEGVILFLLPALFDKTGNSMQAFSGETVINEALASPTATASLGDNVNGLVSGILKFTGKYTDAGVSIKKMLCDIYALIGADRSNTSFTIIYATVLVIFMAITVFAIFISKREDHTLAMLASICIFVPSVSFWYSVLFLLIPVVIFIKDYSNSNCIWDKIEIFLYAVLLAYVTGYPRFLRPNRYGFLIIVYLFVIIRIYVNVFAKNINRVNLQEKKI